MQGHNWGRSHAELYAWMHCNQWDGGEEVVVEAVSARLRVGGWLAPPLTSVAVRVGGVDVGFARARDLARSRGSIGERSYELRAGRGSAAIAGRVEAELEDFVGLYYPNPQGPMTYCLNAKLARAELSLRLPGQDAIELRSRAAALEIGTRRADHGVTMQL
jgi:hypothetical protein